jgi:hypothetical protein
LTPTGKSGPNAETHPVHNPSNDFLLGRDVIIDLVCLAIKTSFYK